MGTCCGIPRHTWANIQCSDIPNFSTFHIAKRYNLIGLVSMRSSSFIVRAALQSDKFESEVIIKSLKKKQSENTDRLLRETEIHKKLNHPHILELKEVVEDEEHLHLVTEYCDGGDLYRFLREHGCFEENLACQWLVEACDALMYLHRQGICHRDIKAENFLVCNTSKGRVFKLADFGLSALDCGGSMHSMVGTSVYAAPEVYLGRYSKTCDVWSLGVTLYLLVSNTLPFYSTSSPDLLRKILGERVNFSGQAWKRISSPLIELLQQMLERDPEKRIRLEEIPSHPWVLHFKSRNDECNSDNRSSLHSTVIEH